MKFVNYILIGIFLVISLIFIYFFGIIQIYERPSEDILELENSHFSDGFENASNFQDLFLSDLSRWHNVQKIPESNNIELSYEKVYSGENSLKLSAEKTNGEVSKSDILREGFAFKSGDDLWFSGWYYIVGGTDAKGVFLVDFEDSTIYQGPGRRVYIQEGESLASDGKWFPSPKVFRSEIPVPKDRWFNLKIHMFLSSDNGEMEVWQDGIKVIDGFGKTIPSDSAIYNRLQIGITANSGLFEQVIYIDNIEVSRKRI